MQYKKTAKETFEFLQNMKKEKINFGDNDSLADAKARLIRMAAIQEILDCLIDTRVEKPSQIEGCGPFKSLEEAISPKQCARDIERNGFQ